MWRYNPPPIADTINNFGNVISKCYAISFLTDSAGTEGNESTTVTMSLLDQDSQEH